MKWQWSRRGIMYGLGTVRWRCLIVYVNSEFDQPGVSVCEWPWNWLTFFVLSSTFATTNCAIHLQTFYGRFFSFFFLWCLPRLLIICYILLKLASWVVFSYINVGQFRDAYIYGFMKTVVNVEYLMYRFMISTNIFIR